MFIDCARLLVQEKGDDFCKIQPVRLQHLLSHPTPGAIDFDAIIKKARGRSVTPQNFAVFSIEHGKTHGVEGSFYSQVSNTNKYIKLNKLFSYLNSPMFSYKSIHF